MSNWKILAFCTLFSFLLLSLSNSSPITLLQSTNGKYYQLVPISIQPHPLKRIARDVFPDTTDQVAEDSSGDQETTTKKEESSDSLNLFKLLHRSRRAQRGYSKYIDSDEYYDDNQDYAGYDRRGYDVGYADKDDDFPTVVW